MNRYETFLSLFETRYKMSALEIAEEKDIKNYLQNETPQELADWFETKYDLLNSEDLTEKDIERITMRVIKIGA